MKFYEVVNQVLKLLQREGRVSYRALKVEFNLNEEMVAALKDELISAKRLAVDEDGKVLVWAGEGGQGDPEPVRSVGPDARRQTLDPRPVSYTPKHLAERILAEREALAARGAPEGERKTITALFVDIKDSTALIEDLDPEEARALIDPALTLMMQAVHRYEGYVAQALGDGIFALFGAPIAHEDHALRAVYAALRMQEEGKKYAERLRREKGLNLQLRVGVNTGEVVVRSIRKDDLQTDYVPVGQSTNLAARLESLATPGSIVVSEQTQRLTEGYFECKALGEARVKGFREPIPLHEVVGVGPVRTRLQGAARRGLSRFVGRQRELEQLARTLEQARRGQGQMVGVMGEPGVGKSRLFHEFKGLHHSGCLVLETFSVSHGKAYACLPLIELLKHYFQLALHDEERVRREKIGGKILMLDRSLEDVLPYLFFLLGLAEPTSPLPQMDPQLRKRRTFEAIKRLLIRESLNQPLILIFEDLHWLDSETHAFLHLLSERLATTRILLLVNYRPEYQHEWGSKTYYTQLRLDPLGEAEAEELLTTLLEARSGWQPPILLHDLKRFILTKTEGNPFFIEEIVQELVEQGKLEWPVEGGARPAVPFPQDLHLPATVQGILAARIDRLPPEEKTLLQTLAVIGKQFAWSLLTQIAEQPEEELHRLLSHLQAKEFIYEQLAFPDIEYVFKHALTQEVAYHAVLVERRKGMHERTAQAMEALYRDRLSDHYGDLAHHYTRSGNTQKAIEYLQKAGQQAVQRSANAEAISRLTLALEVLQTLPDTPARAQRELTLQLALGGPLMATKGFAAAEVEGAYTRARALCQQSGETPDLFPVLWGLWGFYLVRADLQTAQELAEQLLALAQSGQDPALLLQAHYALGVALFSQGDLAPARAHFAQTNVLYEPQQHRPLAFRYGPFDAGVASLSFTALILWLLGYPEQAVTKSQETLALAQALAHPFSLAQALLWTSRFYQLRREERAAQEYAEAALRVSTEQGFSLWLALGTTYRGGALAAQGQTEEGIAQMRQGLADFRATGAEIELPARLTLLVDAHGGAGQTEEGLTVLADALTQVGKSGERLYEAELYRLRGELTLAQSSVQRLGSSVPNPQSPTPNPYAEAEECFQRAIEIARQQQAKSLELRATMSLARLWQSQGKTAEAQQMLAEIYGWFTEGFDTKDLQEAKALLIALEGETKEAV